MNQVIKPVDVGNPNIQIETYYIYLKETTMFKDWSMLFRSHTSPATVILAMMLFLVGGVQLF